MSLFMSMPVRECKSGTTFFTPQQPSERVFVLKSGEAQLYRLDAQGNRLVIRRVGPGTIFGEMGLLGQTAHGCYSEAVKDSIVRTASRDELVLLLEHRPEVTLRLLEMVGGRLKTLEDRLEKLALSPVRTRLADILLALSGQSNGEVVGYSHSDLGDMIGAGRQRITKALGQMRSEGLLQIGHKRIQIAQRDKLRLLVEAS